MTRARIRRFQTGPLLRTTLTMQESRRDYEYRLEHFVALDRPFMY
jgi:hypothetical protein